MSSDEVQITQSSELDAHTGGETGGMIRQGAIVDKSDKICASVMIAHPHSASAVHHHSDQDTIVYAASGYGSVVSGPNGSKRQNLAPGDFALIPAYVEHREVNDGDEEVRWIVCRSGRMPAVKNLEGWSKLLETRIGP